MTQRESVIRFNCRAHPYSGSAENAPRANSESWRHQRVFRLPVFFRHLLTTPKRYCAGKKLNVRRNALPKRVRQSQSHVGGSEISLIPRTLSHVAVVAEDLEVVRVKTARPTFGTANRPNMVAYDLGTLFTVSMTAPSLTLPVSFLPRFVGQPLPFP